MLDVFRLTAFCQELLKAQEIDPTAPRQAWLGALLRATGEVTGAAVAYLGEERGGGWRRHAWTEGELVSVPLRRPGRLSAQAIEEGGERLETRLRRKSGFDPELDGWPGVSAVSFAVAGLPPRSRTRAWLGLLRGREGIPFGGQTMVALRLAAAAASAALGNERTWEKLRRLSLTDELTDIANYRNVRQTIDSQIALALREEQYFSVVMVDVDNLKRYNGAHGHLAGSEILRRLARILRDNVRSSDMAAKYGGDEFLLVLPHTRPTGAMALSERIRLVIEQQLRGQADEVLSCSFGVAGFPEDGCDFESLVRSADQALFRAKGEGRNSVVCLATENRARREDAA